MTAGRLATIVGCTLLAAQSAMAAPLVPQAQSGAKGGTTRPSVRARACSDCEPSRDSLRKAREQLLIKLDSLRWEVENRRLNDAERVIASRAMAQTIRELELALDESVRASVAASTAQRAIVEAQRSAQGYAYSIQTSVRPRGYIGVTFDGPMAEQANTEERVIRFYQYPRVMLVEPGSPAERAGVLIGDTVLALNGSDLLEREFSFTRLLEPNSRLTMRVRRDGNPKDIRVIVAETPDYIVRRLTPVPKPPVVAESPRVPEPQGQARVFTQPAPAAPSAPRAQPPIYWFGNDGFAGARFETLTEGLAQALGVSESGVLVLRSAPGTQAYRSGLRDGDVIVRAAGDNVTTVRDLQRTLLGQSEREAKLVVLRRGKKADVTLRW